jgi:hypothetical protein
MLNIYDTITIMTGSPIEKENMNMKKKKKKKKKKKVIKLSLVPTSKFWLPKSTSTLEDLNDSQLVASFMRFNV